MNIEQIAITKKKITRFWVKKIKTFLTKNNLHLQVNKIILLILNSCSKDFQLILSKKFPQIFLSKKCQMQFWNSKIKCEKHFSIKKCSWVQIILITLRNNKQISNNLSITNCNKIFHLLNPLQIHWSKWI